MLRNYLVTAIRSIRKNRITSVISVAGFSIGIAAALFSFLYARYELSFDEFIPGHGRIYRLYVRAENQYGEGFTSPNISGDVRGMLASRPDIVESFTQVARNSGVMGAGSLSRYEDQSIYSADPSFFRVLGYPLLYGDPATVLERPFSVVLSLEASRRYFGDENPIGKVLKLNENHLGGTIYDLTVTGLLDRMPGNSTFRFDFVANIPPESFQENAARYYNGAYGMRLDPSEVHMIGQTFVKLKSAALYPRFRACFEELLASSPILSGESYRYKKFRLDAERWDDLHLFPATSAAHESRGNLTLLLLLAALSAVVVTLACVNVVNLTTARSMTRMKEVGIRKTLGAGPGELAAQCLVESVLLCLLSLLIASALVELLIPGFNSLFGTRLRLGYLSDPGFAAASLGIAVLVGIVAGLFPAFYLSSAGIVPMLKGQRSPASKRFREGLVVLQFAVSIVLFVVSGTILRQFQSLRGSDLGFDPRDTLMVRLSMPEIERKYPEIKRRFQSLAGVEMVAASSFAGWKYGSFARDFSVSVEGRQNRCDVMIVDADYLRLSGVRMDEGSVFDPELKSEGGRQLIVNETARKVLGLEVGMGLRCGPLVGRVAGICADFDYLFPSGAARPLVLTTDSPFMINDPFAPAPVHLEYLLLKLSGGDRQGLLEEIERTWKLASPGYAFEYRFLDQEISAQIDAADLALESSLRICTIVAFLLSGLGLFGLSTYEIERRTKEIGVRKALGASSAQVAALFLSGFARLALFANLIAWPLAFALIRGTFALIRYPHPLSIGLWPFVGAGLVSLAVTVLTVGAQTLAAASHNPVEALRYE